MTVSAGKVREVRHRSAGCCEYCRVAESRRYARFQIDHIIAIKHGGSDLIDNLCLACFECNSYKGTDIASFDPHTGDLIRLYNPREHSWDDHFELNVDLSIAGLSPEGRATVNILQMNLPHRVIERYEAWISGEYPCTPN